MEILLVDLIRVFFECMATVCHTGIPHLHCKRERRKIIMDSNAQTCARRDAFMVTTFAKVG